MSRIKLGIFVCGAFIAMLLGELQVSEVRGAGDPYPDPDKVISFVVPTPPGGSYDTVTRILTPFLQKYLPREVNFVVLNKPGASMDIGITHVWRAKPDGYTLGIFNLPGNAVNQVTGKARWDLTKMTWIGNVTSTPQMGAVSDKSQYKSFKDLLEAKETFKVATVGINSVAGLASAVTAETFGMKMKPVMHDGGRAAATAALRGDVDYVQLAYPILIRFVGKGITPVIVFDDTPSAGLPNVPTIKDFGHEELLTVATSRFVVGAPPGVPPEIADTLRKAFDQACRDPEFIKKIEQLTKYKMRPTDFAGAEKIVNDSIKVVGKYKSMILERSR